MEKLYTYTEAAKALGLAGKSSLMTRLDSLKKRGDPLTENGGELQRIGRRYVITAIGLEKLKLFEPGKSGRPKDYPQRLVTTGIVYVVTDRMGHYKIGSTMNLKRRVGMLQTGMPTELIVEIWYYSSKYEEEEAKWHRYFASKRIRGEWFILTTSDLNIIRERVTHMVR